MAALTAFSWKAIKLKTGRLRNSGKHSFVAIIEGHPISVKEAQPDS